MRESFNQRFWYEEGGHLYDVIDGEHGDDPSCRPNQIFAISLDHPVLDDTRWLPVFDVVRDRLLTPVGLRSLAPGHRDYKAQYDGDLRARDAAYHQGTVWAWLAGPYVDAWLKIHPEQRDEAHRYIQGFGRHLDEAGIGTLSEIFDAEPPYTPRGCVAQAWSVAEVLRAWMATRAPSPHIPVIRGPAQAGPYDVITRSAHFAGTGRLQPARGIRTYRFILSSTSPSRRNSSPYRDQSPARCAAMAAS